MSKALFFSIFSLFFATMAQAQEAYTKEDVVSFLISTLGKHRGVCIGVLAECAPEERPKGLDMYITFEHNSAELSAEALKELGTFASALKDQRLSAASFVVEGHTDASGGEVYNQILAEARARSVASFLVASGVDGDRLTSLGLGEQRPREKDPFDPLNRRVELRLGLE